MRMLVLICQYTCLRITAHFLHHHCCVSFGLLYVLAAALPE